jgi:DNA-binding NarL/FixJ family response regulator
MRIVLVGAKADRDRLRPDLLEAGFEIVSELSARPSPDAAIDGADAVVEATRKTPALAFRQGVDDATTTAEPLTPRELDVLSRLAEGLPNKAIADALGISDQTVKFHVAAIIGKLGAANRTDAVRRAIRRGLVAI